MAADTGANVDSIRLALSGGGFRATLFHLGVIRYLRETGRLKQVTHLASVSGGSITAAHLILHWNEYTGDEKAFADAATKLVRFVQRDVRGRIVARMIYKNGFLLFACNLLPTIAWYWNYLSALLIVPVAAVLAVVCWKFGWFSAVVTSLTAEYDRLFDGKSLKSLRDTAGAPKALVATTNLSTGAVLYFSDDGLHVVDAAAEHYKCEHLSVAIAVTASSAFPPAFTPVKISSDYLRVDQDKLQTPQYLTDGGVFDNLGGHVLDTVVGPASKTIISSAEPLPDSDLTSSFGLLVLRAARATNILMQRVSMLEMGRRKDAEHIQLMQDVNDEAMAANLQKLVRSIRTDLNGFSSLEVQLLYFKGYLAARHALDPGTALRGFRFSDSGVPIEAEASDRWLPIAGDDKQLGNSTRTLERSSRTPVGKRIGFALTIVAMLFVLPYAAFRVAKYLPPQSMPFTAVRYNATPEQLAMKRQNPWIESFLSDLVTNRPQCNGSDVTAFVQSSPLEEWFWLLRPNSFECDLVCDLPGAKVFYCQAFLIGSDGKLSKMLDVDPGKRMRIRVTEPGRKDRLFVISGICWPDGTKTDELRHHLKLEKPGVSK